MSVEQGKAKFCPFSFNAVSGKLEKVCNDFCKLYVNGYCTVESMSLSLKRIADKIAPREQPKDQE